MVTFESYERRIDRIEKTLKKYGIASLEEAREICLAKGVDVEKIVKGIQPIAFENAVWAYTVGAAIAFKTGTVKHIYFVAETKGSMDTMGLRGIEDAKIHCAREHFKAISGEDVVYDVVDSYQALLEKVMR